ncbi:MAG: nitronate monooxygenase, partial [Maribacter dokdonensis]
QKAYATGANIEELKTLLGRGRAKKGMFLGDLEDGELEIGQVSALIHDIKPADEIVKALMKEFNERKAELSSL